MRSQINLERIETEERKRREDASTVADLEQAAEPNAPVDRTSTRTPGFSVDAAG